MGITAAIVIGGSEMAAGAAGAGALLGGVVTLSSVAGGLAFVGGALSVVGAATGNQHLSQIGGIVGGVGALGVGASALIDSVGAAPAAASGAIAAPAVTDTTATAAATSDTAAATGAATSDTGALNAASSATSPMQGPASALTPGAPAADPMAGYSTAAPNSLTATGMPAGSPTDSLLAGANGVSDPSVAPTASSVAPGVTSNGTPGGGTSGILGAAGAPTPAPLQPALAPINGPSLASASNSLSDGIGPQNPGLWQQFKDLPLKDQLAALQVGSGVVGGIANYIAPSPLQKAQIAEANANTAREQQAIAMTAQRNANLANPKPFFNQPSVNGAPTPTAPSPVNPPINNAPGNAYSLNNNPTAPPGLLQQAGAPAGVPQ